MTEISDLNVVDDSNTLFPEGQAPSTVNDQARQTLGLLARWYEHSGGQLSMTAAVANTYTLTTTRTLTAYAAGRVFLVHAGSANTGAATLNVNGRGAKSIRKNVNLTLSSSDIIAGQLCLVGYNATDDTFQILSGIQRQPVLAGSVDGITLSGNTIVSSVINVPSISGGVLASPVINTPSISGGTIVSPVINTPSISGGTLTGVKLSGTVTLSGSTVIINKASMSGVVINAPVIANGVMGNMSLTAVTIAGGSTLTGGVIINAASISGGTATALHLNNPSISAGLLKSVVINTPSISAGVIVSAVLNSPSISAGVIVSAVLNSPSISGGTIQSLGTPLGIASGGTSASTSASARAALGLAIGTNVQAYSARLSEIAAVSVVKGNLLVANGSAWIRLTLGSDTQVLTADSAEASGIKWATPISNDIVLIEDQKADGTGGGGSTAGAWTARDLNTETIDSGNHASLSSNTVALGAGTYEISARAPFYSVGGCRIRWWNKTDSTVAAISPSYRIGASSGQETTIDAFLQGRFTIAAQKIFELQYFCQTAQATIGLGPHDNQTLGVEVFSQVWLKRTG